MYGSARSWSPRSSWQSAVNVYARIACHDALDLRLIGERVCPVAEHEARGDAPRQPVQVRAGVDAAGALDRGGRVRLGLAVMAAMLRRPRRHRGRVADLLHVRHPWQRLEPPMRHAVLLAVAA